MRKITFRLHPNVNNVTVTFSLINGKAENIKLSGVPKTAYYSFLNQAGEDVDKIVHIINEAVSFAHGFNKDIIETDDFIAGIIYCYQYQQNN